MRTTLIVNILCLLLLSCSEKEEPPASPPAERTVLVYMAADNNLYKNARADIAEMLEAEVPASGKLVVYLDAPAWSEDTCPQLLHIRQGRAIPVKQYGPHNSASGEVLRLVIGDAMSMFPAGSYGLVLWSHGTGWLPQGAYDDLTKSAAPSSAQPQSFGREGGSEIDIAALAEALPTRFEFILFDACLMGSIEVLYQLRGKACTIVASPTETLVAGFPYTEAIPSLFASPAAYAQAAQSYMRYYKRKTGSEQSATIAVVDVGELEEFANLLSKVLRAKEAHITPPDREKIQKYDLLEESVFYDLEDYLANIIEDPAQLLSLRQQLSKLVIYHDFTPYLLAKLPIVRSCGISIYLPSGNAALDAKYRQLDWYISIVSGGEAISNG